MKRIGLRAPGLGWMFGLALAMVVALASASAADARSIDEQYATSTPPSGDGSGASCSYVRSDDGVLNAGDAVAYPGNFSVAPGASVVLDDADGTLGTLIDGDNAKIGAGRGGAVKITVTGDPKNVSGGNGTMNDSVCNSIVASTGISGLAGLAGSSGTSESGGSGQTGGTSAGSTGVAALSVLPETGGPMILVYLGVLAIAGGGLGLLKARASSGG